MEISLSYGNTLPAAGKVLPLSYGNKLPAAGMVLPLSYGNVLPYEIWFHIFRFSDPFDICVIKRVCKAWNELSAPQKTVNQSIMHNESWREVAVRFNRLDMLKLDKKYKNAQKIVNHAAIYGYIRIMKHYSICDVDWEWTMGWAGTGGFLDVIKFCESKGAANFHDALRNAVVGKYEDVIHYCASKTKNGWNLAFSFALNNTYLDLMKYCEKNGASEATIYPCYCHTLRAYKILNPHTKINIHNRMI